MTAAIIGAGRMGRIHAAAYRAAGASVVAVCDVDASLAGALAAACQAAAYTSLERMLDETRPRVVSICTPPVAHLAAAQAAARRRIPFLCEKPLAATLPAAEAIVAAARDAGVACMTGFCHRFHEPVLQVKALLHRQEIGEPVLFRSRFAYRFEAVERSWFADRAVGGGGTVMDTSVHSLDLYRFLFGEITAVAAQLTTHTPGLAVEDTSVLLVNGPAAVPGIIEASWTTPVGASELVIFGTRGTLTVDYTAGDFGVARLQRADELAATELRRSRHDRFAAEIASFLSRVGAGREPTPDGHDGLRAMQVIAAAYAATRGTGCAAVPM
jgi:predicted dehydrogenase